MKNKIGENASETKDVTKQDKCSGALEGGQLGRVGGGGGGRTRSSSPLLPSYATLWRIIIHENEVTPHIRARYEDH